MKNILLASAIVCMIVVFTWPVAYLSNHPELLPTLPAKEDVEAEPVLFTGNQADAGNAAQETFTPVFTGNPAPVPSLSVNVTTSTLEKRSQVGGGENVGYWQEGDLIEVSWACGTDTGDIWIAFAGGWSAAKFEGREFVSPLPVGTEVCDE